VLLPELPLLRAVQAVAVKWPRLRFDCERGDVLELSERRWFQWGHFTRDGVSEAWYWLLRLPSYEMRPVIYLGPRAPWQMHQLCLVWVEPFFGPYEDWQGLKLQHLPL
jgi:hypothetical protein